MRIVISGAGEVGFNLAKHLIEGGNDVVVIDKDKDRISYVNEHLDCLVIEGEATNFDVLKQSNMESAEIYVAVTDSDEVNMISCLVVHSNFNVATKIARVRNIEYHKSNLFNNKITGFDYLVNPEIEAAKSIIRAVEYGAVSDIFVFDDTDVQLREVFVDKDVNIEGKTIEQLRKGANIPFVVAGIYRNNELLIPTGKDIINRDDHLFVVGTKESLDRLFIQIGLKRRKIKSVVIAGGGKIQRLVVEGLTSMGREIIIIEKDYEKSKKLADLFPNALVINSDISDESLLEEEDLGEKDLIITATDNDEINILSASYYKSLGVKRAIALVDKTKYLHMSSTLGIDITISPKISAVNTILKFIKKGNIVNIYSLFDGKAEAIEFLLRKDTSLDGLLVRDLNLPKNVVLVAVNRDGKSYIPDGNFLFRGGDIVIIFALKDSVKEIEEFFLQ
ncbi:MAG: Trk system potassium transporter TrkA [Calditerrivibrio sp.]|nr:Trk system potassium transporter TrkA [Calditerrivibrio sp.]